MKDKEVSQKLEEIFQEILGVSVDIIYDVSFNDKETFIKLIKDLELSFETEDKIWQISGIELSNITNPLWGVVENLLLNLYGDETTQLIFWYIFDRKDKNDEIIPLKDDSGREIIIDTPYKLWNYIKQIFKEK